MSLPLVLNTHSLPFESQEAADEGVLEFINVFHRCARYGYNILLRSPEVDPDLMYVMLADQYSFQNWYSHARQSPSQRDITRKFRSIATRPLFDGVELPEELEAGLKDNDERSDVLLAAHHHDTFLCSFSSHESWTGFTVQGWVLDLMVEGDADQLKDKDFPNLSTGDSLSHHEPAMEQTRNNQLSRGRDILTERETFFPKLFFLENQIGQALRRWTHRADILPAARSAMLVLNEFAQKWENGELADYQHRYLSDLGLQAEVSGESESVRTTPKKRNERMFNLDDGRCVFCENHVKLPSGFRLHFYPDTANKQIILAYLGPHLTL
ncbi:hypothetical protein [Maridesulfovibrio sp.]|uniref:hypothetical protein n=1 Tax=unclassified Maridesulfovibrio TaxID=2794999 RepID=UPI003B00F157